MVKCKIMQFVRARQKKLYQCNSSSSKEGPLKHHNSSDTLDLQQRHAAFNLTYTNQYRRSSTKDSYRESCNFSRNVSITSLGSDGCGSGSSSVGCEPDLHAPRDMLAGTFASVLDKLSDDGPFLLPQDQFDDGSSTASDVSVKILVLFCDEDEKIGNLFIDYLRRAFPFTVVMDQWDDLYGTNEFDHWQDIVDTVSFVFILMSQDFLNSARQKGMMSKIFQEMEISGTNMIPIYLEKITREESDFLMDFENRWGISVQRNGFSNLHSYLKRSFTRHFMINCTQRF